MALIIFSLLEYREPDWAKIERRSFKEASKILPLFNFSDQVSAASTLGTLSEYTSEIKLNTDAR
jgi:hypothetical protein